MPDKFRDRVKDSKKSIYWRPEKEGDFITGIVKGFRAVTSRFGDAEVMEIIEDESKELTSIFLSSVIKHEREKQNIQPKDHIGVKYLGEVEGENFEYKDFIVMVDRPEKREAG